MRKVCEQNINGLIKTAWHPTSGAIGRNNMPDIQFAPTDERLLQLYGRKDPIKDAFALKVDKIPNWRIPNPGEFDYETVTSPEYLANHIPQRTIYADKALALIYGETPLLATERMDRADKARQTDPFFAKVQRNIPVSRHPGIFGNQTNQLQAAVDYSKKNKNWTAIGNMYDLLLGKTLQNLSSDDIPGVRLQMQENKDKALQRILDERNEVQEKIDDYRKRKSGYLKGYVPSYLEESLSDLKREEQLIRDRGPLGFSPNNDFDEAFDQQPIHSGRSRVFNQVKSGPVAADLSLNPATLYQDLLDPTHDDVSIYDPTLDPRLEKSVLGSYGSIGEIPNKGEVMFGDQWDNLGQLPDFLKNNTLAQNGFNNPNTNVIAPYLLNRNSTGTHEFTHAVNMPSRRGLVSTTVATPPPDNSLVKGLMDTFDTGGTFKSLGGPSTYGAYTGAEATQSSAAAKRLASYLHRAKFGHNPINDQQWSDAYDMLAQQKKPLSFEHGRFVNYLTPNDDYLVPRNLKEYNMSKEELYKHRFLLNFKNWKDAMMKKNDQGYSLTDMLVHNGMEGVKSANIKGLYKAAEQL